MNFDEKLAKLVVQFSVDVQPKESVLILGNEYVKDFIYALYIEVLKKTSFSDGLYQSCWFTRAKV